MGPALFDNPTRRLSPGAECLKDYLLKDFPADMLREDIETSVPLARVLKITRDLIQDLRAGMEERDAFVKNYEISKMSAVEAANNVIELAKTMDDEEKGRRKKQHATIWCANELKKLEMKGAELAGQVARARECRMWLQSMNTWSRKRSPVNRVHPLPLNPSNSLRSSLPHRRCLWYKRFMS